MSQPVRFDVISDVQGDVADLDVALAAFAEFPPADQLLINGDLTLRGYRWQWDELMARLAATPHPPVLFTIGNHDFYLPLHKWRSSSTAINRFRNYTAMPGLYSAHDVGGVRVLRLGSIDGRERGGHEVVLGDAQLQWLATELAAPRTRGPVLVASHHVLPRTISATGDDPVTQAPNVYQRDYAEADRLLEILGAHPEVLFLSGHTHWSLYRDDWFTRRIVAGGDPAGFAVANTGAVQFGWEANGRGGEQAHDDPQNQGLRIVVTDDQVRIHALDFAARVVIHTVEFAVGSPDIRQLSGLTWADALS